MIVPIRSGRFSDALRMGIETFHALKALLHKRGMSTAVGDEGGFAPAFRSTKEAIDALMDAISAAGYQAGEEIGIAFDVAATNLHKAGNYDFQGEGVVRSLDDLIEYYDELISSYPILSIEDGVTEDDWGGWTRLTARLGRKTQLVGDDVFVTNATRLREGIARGCANAILVKVNQIGTLTETLDVTRMAQQAGYATIISHRSGETEDTTIADLAVATGAGQIKTGAPSRSERVAKYNQLLRIEEELGDKAIYPGASVFKSRAEARKRGNAEAR